jgi:hypothetical protein
MQFGEKLRHQQSSHEFFLHNILRTDEACSTREGVFNLHSCHIWARDNPHDIHERGYRFRSAFGLVSSETSWAPLRSLAGWLLNSTMIFLELFYWDCFKMCL